MATVNVLCFDSTGFNKDLLNILCPTPREPSHREASCKMLCAFCLEVLFDRPSYTCWVISSATKDPTTRAKEQELEKDTLTMMEEDTIWQTQHDRDFRQENPHTNTIWTKSPLCRGVPQDSSGYTISDMSLLPGRCGRAAIAQANRIAEKPDVDAQSLRSTMSMCGSARTATRVVAGRNLEDDTQA